MKIQQRFKGAINAFRGDVNKNAALAEARSFLKYGNGQRMTPDWSQVIMSDEDNYTGYMYGAIDIRAVAATKLGEYNLATKASDAIMKSAKEKDEVIVHPYIELIEESDDFSDFDFWYDNATYLDLKGVAYIMAVRNIAANGYVGKIQSFKILSPFDVQRIFDQKTGELIGYREYRNGMSRDIPKDMIIPVIKLNPFDKTKVFSMTDAAKDHQFTIKTANDYTRSAIRNNQNAPGIISTDAVLEGEQLQNFKDRVMGRVKGEPIFGGGAGSIEWQDMQSDLNKSALTDVNSISLQNIIAVSGASKTMLGWEESGTTRDTSLVQKANFIEYRAMPLVQKIIDALNQDYKTHYKAEYARTKYKIYIDNPLGSDREAEKKDIEIRTSKEELYSTLVDKGYDRELAARYADGEITLIELGEPTNEPKQPEIKEETDTEEAPQEEMNAYKEYKNQVESGLLNQTQSSLQNTIVNIDERIVAEAAKNVQKVRNELETEEEVVSKKQKAEYERELNTALFAFYSIIIPLYAYNTLSERAETYGKLVSFKTNNQVRNYIKMIAAKAAESHTNTTVTALAEFARKEALKGRSRDVIATNLVNKFGEEVSKSRAVLIARTETNRAFTMSQYQADLQFIKGGGFSGKAYKQWVTRGTNPCEFCQAMEAKGKIPFSEPFASVGDELTATAEIDGKTVVRKQTVGFVDADAGNLHPNCSCSYELIIEGV